MTPEMVESVLKHNGYAIAEKSGIRGAVCCLVLELYPLDEDCCMGMLRRIADIVGIDTGDFPDSPIRFQRDGKDWTMIQHKASIGYHLVYLYH